MSHSSYRSFAQIKIKNVSKGGGTLEIAIYMGEGDPGVHSRYKLS